MEVLKEASQLGVNLYEEHQRFVQSFEPQWRSDENVMLLLSAIALFTPERCNVVHKDVVKYEQVIVKCSASRAHVMRGPCPPPQYFRIYLIGVDNLDIFKNFILEAAPQISDPNVGPECQI